MSGSRRAPLSVVDAVGVFLLVVVGLVFVGGLLLRFGLAGLAAGEILLVAGPVLLIARARDAFIGLRRPRLRDLAGALCVGSSLWFVIVAVVLPIQQMIAPTPPELERELARLAVPDAPLPFILLGVAVVPAICEELLCRGALCFAVAARWGAVVGVLVSSLLFALLHVSPYRMAPTFLLGVSLGTLTLRSRCLWPSMIVHATHNAAVVLASLPGLSFGPWLATHPVIALPVAVGLVTIGHMLVFSRSRAPE